MITSWRGLFDELLNDGWPRVWRLKSEAEEESLHLDFKEVRPGAIPSQEDYIKEKYAKALSGFANTGGGMLVYGIKTNGAAKGTPDRAQDVVEIENVAAFRADLDRLAARVVEPIIPAVEIKEIERPGGGGRGVVLAYVPPSSAGPHRAVRTKVSGVDDHYYVRVGTEFHVASHPFLAMLFTRSSPRVVIQLRLIPRGARVEVSHGIPGGLPNGQRYVGLMGEIDEEGNAVSFTNAVSGGTNPNMAQEVPLVMAIDQVQTVVRRPKDWLVSVRRFY